MTTAEPGSPRAFTQKLFKLLQDLLRTFPKSAKMTSKADISQNWREPLPAAAKKLVSQQMRPQYSRAPQFRTRAFAKKEPIVVKNYFGPWESFNDYRPGLKCELCKTTIRKTINPQEIRCGHIFCEGCINLHYNIKNNYTCPTCKEYLDYRDDPHFSDDRESYGPEEDDGCPGCGDKWCDGRCDEEPNCSWCRSGCDGTCGALSCGCIDVCRGRCNSDGYGW